MTAADERGESSFGYADVRPLTDALMAEVHAEIGDRLTAVVLYGSVARGEAHRWSDIDLFVVHRGDRETVSEAFLHAKLRLRNQRLARELTARGVPTVPVAVYRSEEELVDTPWLMLDMTHHGILLFDPRGVLGRKLARLRARLEELGSRRIELDDGSWYWDLKPDLRPGEVVTL
ncbi:MAG: nucleotidyltransferase domain-containing protein [Spirochaetaceae bacterium]|nr:nucleotidyltransferase domain-containing protein [Spirochaetaceae bacterium]